MYILSISPLLFFYFLGFLTKLISNMYSFHINICNTGINIETFSYLPIKKHTFSKTKMTEAKTISSPMVGNKNYSFIEFK